MYKNWRDLIKPKRLEATELTETYGKFVAEPFERGWYDSWKFAAAHFVVILAGGSDYFRPNQKMFSMNSPV